MEKDPSAFRGELTDDKKEKDKKKSKIAVFISEKFGRFFSRERRDSKQGGSSSEVNEPTEKSFKGKLLEFLGLKDREKNSQETTLSSETPKADVADKEGRPSATERLRSVFRQINIFDKTHQQPEPTEPQLSDVEPDLSESAKPNEQPRTKPDSVGEFPAKNSEIGGQYESSISNRSYQRTTETVPSKSTKYRDYGEKRMQRRQSEAFKKRLDENEAEIRDLEKQNDQLEHQVEELVTKSEKFSKELKAAQLNKNTQDNIVTQEATKPASPYPEQIKTSPISESNPEPESRAHKQPSIERVIPSLKIPKPSEQAEQKPERIIEEKKIETKPAEVVYRQEGEKEQNPKIVEKLEKIRQILSPERKSSAENLVFKKESRSSAAKAGAAGGIRVSQNASKQANRVDSKSTIKLLRKQSIDYSKELMTLVILITTLLVLMTWLAFVVLN